MKPKASKYDTNPLDPEVGRRTEEVWGQQDGAPGTESLRGATRRVVSTSKESPRANAYSEAPTRRYDPPASLDSPYPSVFVPPTAPPTYAPPAIYQPPVPQYQPPLPRQPGARTVEGLGLPEKWAVVLPYTPLYIGIVASIVELLLVPRQEVRVRAHAAQGLALHIAIIAIEMLFFSLSLITGSSAGGTLFKTAALIFLIISMIRVGKGETHRIAPVAEPAQWLNKHIDPRQ
jgi:uncharacterized membrane protein